MMKTTMTTMAAAMWIVGCGMETPNGFETEAASDLSVRARVLTPAAAAQSRGDAIRSILTAPSVVRPTPTLPGLPDRGQVDPAPAEHCVPSAMPSALVQTAAAAGVEMPGATMWRYRIDQIDRLFVGAYVRNVCGPQVAIFDLYAPDGSFYDRLSLSFQATGEGVGARKVGDGYVVEVALPIAGTAIRETPLTGTWSVNFSLSNDSLAVGVGLFELYR